MDTFFFFFFLPWHLIFFFLFFKYKVAYLFKLGNLVFCFSHLPIQQMASAVPSKELLTAWVSFSSFSGWFLVIKITLLIVFTHDASIFFRIAERDRQLSDVQAELHELKEKVELYRRKNDVRISFVSTFPHQLVVIFTIPSIKRGRLLFFYKGCLNVLVLHGLK